MALERRPSSLGAIGAIGGVLPLIVEIAQHARFERGAQHRLDNPKSTFGEKRASRTTGHPGPTGILWTLAHLRLARLRPYKGGGRNDRC